MDSPRASSVLENLQTLQDRFVLSVPLEKREIFQQLLKDNKQTSEDCVAKIQDLWATLQDSVNPATMKPWSLEFVQRQTRNIVKDWNNELRLYANRCSN